MDGAISLPETILRALERSGIQPAGEPLRVFNRKFRELAEMAYRTEHRNVNQVKILIRLYIKGLNNKVTARNMLRSSPAALADAMAIDQEEVEEALQRLGP